MEKSKKKTSTLKDVAKEAGVSVGTVSNYLKDPSKVKKVNREKIKNAVEDLQFIPDINAQILATGKSKVVILYVVSESAISPSTWLHQLPIMQVLHDELQKENYVLQFNIAYADQMEEFEKSVRYNVESNATDGILILSVWEIKESILEYLQERKVPYVLLDSYTALKGANEIYFDNQAIIKESVKDMYQKGHRRFRYISVRSGQQDMKDRYKGFLEGMKSCHLPVRQSDILYGDFSVDSGYQCISKALQEDSSFTAIIAGNDNMAVGAMMAIHEAGFSVPEDYSVCGVDNDNVGKIFNPKLNTVEFNLIGMAKQASKCLLSQLQGKKHYKKRYIMEHRRIDGGTIKKIND